MSLDGPSRRIIAEPVEAPAPAPPAPAEAPPAPPEPVTPPAG
jgi:hypothetical protein